VLFLLPIYIGVHAFILPQDISVLGITDAGYISIITLTFIACSFVSLLTLVFNTRLNSSKLTTAAAAYSLLVYFMREADLHRLLTIEHVTRGKFYSMPDVPLWQKLFAALVFLLLTLALLYLLFKYARLIWNSVGTHEPWAIAIVFWFTVLFISQLCDKSDLNHTHIGRVIEECCECWAAIFIFLSIIQLIPQLRLKTAST